MSHHRFIPFAIIALLSSSLLITTACAPARAGETFFEFYSGYKKNVETAYSYFLEGDFEAALKYYEASLKDATLTTDEITALLGKQNCLIKLGRYQEALDTGLMLLELVALLQR
ncbi:MAG: CDC27 family protein [bacterium]|jgi:tetratricopeptide (TPR) repeat protein|nr:CDC27 family protein [bacterium]